MHICSYIIFTFLIVINDEKCHIKVIEGAYAPMIMQFGGEIGQIVYTYSVIYPKISISSKQKKHEKGNIMNLLCGANMIFNNSISAWLEALFEIHKKLSYRYNLISQFISFRERIGML